MHQRVLTAIVIVAAALSLVGCQRIETALEPEPVIVTEEATAAAAAAPVEGELAEKTPSDLPLWPASKVLASEYNAGAYSLTLSTGDPYEDVLNGVAAGFERAGWDVAVEDDGEVGLRTAVLTVGSDRYDGLVTLSEVDTASVEIEYILTGAEK